MPNTRPSVPKRKYPVTEQRMQDFQKQTSDLLKIPITFAKNVLKTLKKPK